MRLQNEYGDTVEFNNEFTSKASYCVVLDTRIMDFVCIPLMFWEHRHSRLTTLTIGDLELGIPTANQIIIYDKEIGDTDCIGVGEVEGHDILLFDQVGGQVPSSVTATVRASPSTRYTVMPLLPDWAFLAVPVLGRKCLFIGKSDIGPNPIGAFL